VEVHRSLAPICLLSACRVTGSRRKKEKAPERGLFYYSRERRWDTLLWSHRKTPRHSNSQKLCALVGGASSLAVGGARQCARCGGSVRYRSPLQGPPCRQICDAERWDSLYGATGEPAFAGSGRRRMCVSLRPPWKTGEAISCAEGIAGGTGILPVIPNRQAGSLSHR